MTVVPVQTALFDESLLAVKIATYARIVGLSECVIYGVNDGVSPSQCDPVWSHAQRIMLWNSYMVLSTLHGREPHVAPCLPHNRVA